ncbi:MAG: 1,4-dihydroxy-2-naphthoate octaprenyltransferase [Rhodospirillales bacterium]|nr:MAG: 1,4-dihydroxy-2-naphthoate octaprenyltransferase [Rhodospirillales bacterium]
MKTEPGKPPSQPVLTGPIPASHAANLPRGIGLWWRAIRPRTLSIAAAPVLAGTALAFAEQERFNLFVLAATLTGALAIQAGTNLFNDVADYLKGGDQPLRQGPPRVTAMGWASPHQVKRAALVSFLMAALCGLFLVLEGGIPILILGLAALWSGWAYSLGARPIAYTPLGELFVIAFFGLGAVGGTYYLQTLNLTASALSVGLALGLFAAGVLMVNNYRDMEPDRLAGRRTLAILVGPDMSRVFFAACTLLPFALVLMPPGPRGAWMTLFLLPYAFLLIHRFKTLPRGPAFNQILAATARLELAFAILIATGATL